MGKWEELAEFFGGENDEKPYHARLACIESKLDELLQNQENMMSQLDDLNAAANAVASIIDQIRLDEDSVLAQLAALQKAGGANLAPVIAQLQGIHDKAVLADNALAAAIAAPAPVVTPPGVPGPVVTPPGVTPPPPVPSPVVTPVPPRPVP